MSHHSSDPVETSPRYASTATTDGYSADGNAGAAKGGSLGNKTLGALKQGMVGTRRLRLPCYNALCVHLRHTRPPSRQASKIVLTPLSMAPNLFAKGSTALQTTLSNHPLHVTPIVAYKHNIARTSGPLITAPKGIQSMTDRQEVPERAASEKGTMHSATRIRPAPQAFLGKVQARSDIRLSRTRSVILI